MANTKLIFAVLLMLLGHAGRAAAQETKIKWLGHAAGNHGETFSGREID